jgi:hypothetical protein
MNGYCLIKYDDTLWLNAENTTEIDSKYTLKYKIEFTPTNNFVKFTLFIISELTTDSIIFLKYTNSLHIYFYLDVL